MLQHRPRRGRLTGLVTLALVAASLGPASADPGDTAPGGARASAFFPTQRLTSNSGTSYMPSVAVSGAVVHVAWRDTSPGNAEIFYRRSVDSAAHWLTRMRMTTNGGDSRQPVLAVDAATVHLVWEDEKAPADFSVWYRRSLTGGATWKPARRISPPHQNALRADIAVVGQNVHVVWENHSGATVNIWYRRSRNAGVNWDPPVRLSRDNGHSQLASVAAIGPYVHVVWSDTRDGGGTEVYHRRSIDGGGSWSGARRLSFKPGGSWDPTVEVGGAVVHVGWQEDAWGYDVAYKRSPDNGATWQPARNLSKCTGQCLSPAIAVSSAGVDAVWTDSGSATGTPQLRYRRSLNGGVTWAQPIWLTNTSGVVEWPAIAGWGPRVHMVWDDDTPGNDEIYHKRRG